MRTAQLHSGSWLRSTLQSFARRLRRREARRNAHIVLSRAIYETVEPRLVLASALSSAIPTTITPSSVAQELFAPGVNNYGLSLTSTGVFSSSFRFVLNNAQAGQNITFGTDATEILAPDAAIAIFDSSGNRIALQDLDSPSSGDETLNIPLESGTEYVVGFYGRRVFGGNTGIALSVNTGAQSLGNTIRLDPATNSASLSTASSPNSFEGSKNVRFFPLDLINAGSSAQIDIAALNPDASVRATLYLMSQSGIATKQATATSTPGGTTQLLVSPPSNQNVTDGIYMLAVAPLNFTAAAAPVNITASSFSAIASPTVSPASATPLQTPALTTSGTLTTNLNDSFNGGGKLYSIVPSVTGPMQVDLSIGGNPARITVYGPGGTSIVEQATNNSVVPVSLTFNAIAGTQYFILGSMNGGGILTPISVSTTQALVATNIAANTTLGQQANLNIAPNSGGKLFRLTSDAGSRFVAIQLAPDAGSSLLPKLELFGATNVVQTIPAVSAGQPATVILDTSTNAGPYTIFASSLSGTGTASLKYITLNLPATMSLAGLSQQTLTLSTGSAAGPVFTPTTGQTVGIQYYQPVNGANAAPTTYSAISTNGAMAVLLHYVQDGSVLRLMDTAAPTAGGIAAVSVPARAQVVHAVVALPVNFGGTGNVQLTVAGPLPKGIGLDMVPNALPNAPTPVDGYKSTVSVNGAKLSSNQQRDLYSTTLPFNLVGSTSTLTYTPAEVGGPLRVTVSVLNASNVVIANATSNAGAPVSVPLTGLVAGQTLRFEVKPVNNINLGTGEYGFSMAVNTTDPRPFLVTQPIFLANNNGNTGPHFPSTAFTPLLLNAQNTGTATGNFTSSTPYANNGTGSIQVFEIDGATANIPYQITTTAIDPGVNTNFAIYYYRSATNQYERVPGTAPSFDYFPGDRSSVDARIVVNNLDVAPIFAEGEFGGPIKIYAVVMNEGGSRGQYRVTVEPAPQITAGPGNLNPLNQIVPAPRAGATNLGSTLTTIQTVNGSTFTVRTPADMNGSNGVTSTLRVQTRDFSTGQTINVSVSRNGFIFVGSTSAVVGAGGVVNIQLDNVTSGGALTPMLGANTTYDMTITASSMPSQGLALSLTVPYATVSGTVPPSSLSTAPIPTTASYVSQLDRLHPAPNGAITDSVTTVGGAFQTLFSMPKAGSVSFTINSTSGGTPAVGLYRAGKTPNSPYQDVSVLMHFDNTRTSNNFVINANLPAGTYWLRGQSFDNVAPVAITGTIPAYVSSTLSVQPGTGLTTQAEQTIINRGASGNTNAGIVNGFPSSQFVSSYFNFTVPANATGAPVTFSLFDRTSTFAGASPIPPVGTASLSIYRFQNGTFTLLSTLENAVNTSTHAATISAGEAAVPGAVYYVGVDFNAFQWAAYGGFNVPVFTSGVADFSVQPIVLSPNAGQTLVQSAITNASFSASSIAGYTLQLGSATSQRTIPPLAPFGQLLVNVPWQPGAASDVVSINANPTASVAELSRTNNAQSVALSSVNPTAPTVTISLVDANMTAEGIASATTGGGTWGRYVSGVSGQTSTIRFVGGDVDSNLFNIVGVLRTGADQRYVVNASSIFNVPTSTSTVNIPIDFGNLAGTTSSSPNRLQFYAVDTFGLKTPVFFQTMDVATPGGFLTGGFPAPGVSGAGGTITFNRSTRQFKYDFQNSVISLNPTLSELLNFDVPFIGDKKNELLVAITGTGTSGLSPNIDIPMALTGIVKVSAVDKEIVNKTYPGNYQSGAVSFTSQVTLNGRSLVPGSVSATLVVKDLQLLDVQTPTIPLFRFGAPGIAELHAGVKFGLKAKLNAAAKIGFDPLAGSVGGYLGSLGVMSPTFIQPEITGTATVTGEAEVLGFDIAEISGSIGLTLTITLGVDNNVPGKIIPFTTAASNLGLSVHAALNYSIKAEAFWVDVYEYEDTLDLGNVVNTIDQGIFLTDPPSFAAGKFIAPPGRRPASGQGGVTPTIKNGSSLVGAYNVDPRPQLVINNSTLNGIARSIQVRNVGTASAPLANLAFTDRNGGAWSSLTNLSQTTDVSAPELALTNDGANSPAVVVYGVNKVAGSPSTQTLNQRLNNTEIRYRYHNGTSWGAEQTLTSDSLLDTQHSIAFNASGAGVLAYVHNSNSAPINGSGAFDGASNDIRASSWNAATHTWGAPVTITTGNGSDSMPSTFVDASGKSYITWINTNAGVSQLMYATNTGGVWSAPAVLQTTGLVAGGTFRSVAMGSDGAGRANVIFSYQTENADGSLATALYQRPATTAGFASSQPAVQIAANSTYSGLRTTNAPNGSLVAYWQQSDGQENQIYQVSIANGVATGPLQVSTSQNIARSPSAAIDGDGKIQLMYNDSILFGDTANGAPTDPSIGAPVANGVASSSVASLPQLTFVNNLAFPVESGEKAPIGSTIVGTAKIANRGLVGTSVTINAFNGLPGTGTLVGTRTINLAPGATFDVAQNFVVAAGTNTYSLQLTTPTGQAFNTSENVSSTTLSGLTDLAAISLINDVSSPSPGTSQTLFATVRNNGSTTAGNFNVTLYAGDPNSPQLPLTALGTQTVSGLAGLTNRTLSFVVNLGANAGDNVYTIVVDPAELVAESNELNNRARYEVNFRSDPAVATLDSSPPVVATLLNSGTSNNVQVDVKVSNLGQTPMVNVPVNLTVTRDGGVVESLGQIIIPSLAVGATQTVTFTVTSKAGDNVYFASIDSSVFSQDSNLSNNSGSALLRVVGVAALSGNGTVSTPSSSAGSPLTINATFTNAGLADAVNVPYVVYASLTSGGPSILIGSGSINMPALGSVNAAITLDTSTLPSGSYTFTVRIDPSETVVEDTVSNNSFAVTHVIATPVVLGGPAHYLKLSADGLSVLVWNNSTGTGSPNQTLLLSATPSITVTAAGGSQNLTLDFSAGNPIPGSSLLFNAPSAGNNTLTLVGTSGANSFAMNGNTITYTSGAISSSIARNNVSSVAIVGGGGADVINLNYANGNPLPANWKLDGTFTLNGFQDFNNTTLDLFRSTLFISYPVDNTVASTIRAYLTRGYNNGSWNGVATSTAGSINTSAGGGATQRSIGYADFGDGRDVNLTPNTVMLKFTHQADSDLNGTVDFVDLLRMAQNYGAGSNVWDQGDFTYDGVVNFNDLLILAQGYGQTLVRTSVSRTTRNEFSRYFSNETIDQLDDKKAFAAKTR